MLRLANVYDATIETSSTRSCASPSSMYGGSGAHRPRPVAICSFVTPGRPIVLPSISRTESGHDAFARAALSVTIR
jgi:hypothetical protein